jgi:hypothetical protein
MIEVDVRQQQRPDIPQRQAALAETVLERGQTRGRTGIDQRHAVGSRQHRGCDYPLAAAEAKVDVIAHSLNDSVFMISA